jgi:hypothetical protein
MASTKYKKQVLKGLKQAVGKGEVSKSLETAGLVVAKCRLAKWSKCAACRAMRIELSATNMTVGHGTASFAHAITSARIWLGEVRHPTSRPGVRLSG